MLGVGIGLIIYGLISFFIEKSSGSDDGVAVLYLVAAAAGVVFLIIGLIRRNSEDNSKQKSEFTCNFNNLTDFQDKANTVLTKNGYTLIRQETEYVWEKKAFGASVYSYVSIEYDESTAKINGWVVGPGGEQMTLDGFVGIVYKRPVKKIIRKIMALGN
jgi:hypothetical protein